MLLGGGGLAIEILDYMSFDGIKPVGYYSPEKDDDLSGVLSWLGNEKDSYESRFTYVISSGYTHIRKMMIDFIEKNNLDVYTFISSQSYVSSLAEVGKGAVIAPYAAITGNPIIGKYLLANIHSSISHHSIVGDNVVVGPGARITGRCQLGSNVYMGANSCLLPETIIENDIDIGISTFPNNRAVLRSNTSVVGKPGIGIPKGHSS